MPVQASPCTVPSSTHKLTVTPVGFVLLGGVMEKNVSVCGLNYTEQGTKSFAFRKGGGRGSESPISHWEMG